MFELFDMQMNKINFPRGVEATDSFVSSISKNRTAKQLNASNKTLNQGSTYGTRQIKLDFYIESADTEDFRLLRNEFHSIISANDTFYIVERYDKGKRYKVTCDDSYEIERVKNNRRIAEIMLDCTSIELPFAESIGTTLDIEKNGINANDDLWSFGMGLLADDDSVKYTHNNNTFKIYNAGNVLVHPFEMDMRIDISNVSGSSSYLQLENLTTGDVFKVNEAVKPTDVITLDKMNVLINKTQALRKTNKNYIRLAQGWNQFKITGATRAKVNYDFRFYYF